MPLTSANLLCEHRASRSGCCSLPVPSRLHVPVQEPGPCCWRLLLSPCRVSPGEPAPSCRSRSAPSAFMSFCKDEADATQLGGDLCDHTAGPGQGELPPCQGANGTTGDVCWDRPRCLRGGSAGDSQQSRRGTVPLPYCALLLPLPRSPGQLVPALPGERCRK